MDLRGLYLSSMKELAFGRGRKVPVAPVLRGPSREARPTPLRSTKLRVSKKSGNAVFMRCSALFVFLRERHLGPF